MLETSLRSLCCCKIAAIRGAVTVLDVSFLYKVKLDHISPGHKSNKAKSNLLMVSLG